MGILTAFAVLAAVLAAVFYNEYRRKLRREMAELELVGREIQTGFAQQLITAVSHIYNRTKMCSKVECSSPSRWFWLRRYRILLTVKLSLKADLSTVELMLKDFLDEYLARTDQWKYRVRVLIQPIPTEGEVR